MSWKYGVKKQQKENRKQIFAHKPESKREINKK